MASFWVIQAEKGFVEILLVNSLNFFKVIVQLVKNENSVHSAL